MEVTSNDQVIELSGSPYERGRTLGEASADRIAKNLEIVRGEREKVIQAGVSQTEYDGALDANHRFVQEVDPETLEEIRGVAVGSGIAYEALLDLNLMAYFPLGRMMAECSQLLVGPHRTADGAWFLAKSRDMTVPSLVQSVVHRRYDDGLEIGEAIHSGAVTSPGAGLNSHGLAISTSGVWPRGKTYRLADAGRGWNLINPHLLLKNCRNVDDLEGALISTPRHTGMNVVAMDGTVGASFELSPTEVVRSNTDDGHTILTNHCPTANMAHHSPTRDEYASTFDRYDRLSDLVVQAEDWKAGDVWAAMSDHIESANSSVCRHPDPADARPGVTAWASVATLPEQHFHVAMGNPCETSPVAHTTDSIKGVMP